MSDGLSGRQLLKLLRPQQWIKNLILFFPPLLGGRIGDLAPLGRVLLLAPLAFCLVSSAAYVLNDLLDEEADRSHPQKSRRPLPAGRISRLAAGSVALTVFMGGIVAGSLISLPFVLLLLGYAGIAGCYSFRLKHLPVVDLFCISAGFLLRLHAGGIAFGVPVSDWLFLSVFLLSIFLSAGKRAGEQSLLGGGSGRHRSALDAYPQGFLEGTMIFSGAAALVAYAIYTIAHPRLVYTVPLCAFGLLRYLLRVKQGGGGDPTESLLKDGPLFSVGLLWAVMVGWSLYG